MHTHNSSDPTHHPLLEEVGPLVTLEPGLLERLLVHEDVLVALEVRVLPLAAEDVGRFNGLPGPEGLLNRCS